MSLLSDAAQALIDGEAIGIATLVEMSFSSSQQRVWNGFGPLVTYAGGEKIWTGLGDLVSVSEIPAQVGTEATQVTLTVSGDWPEMAEVVRLAATNADEAEGRRITIYHQFGRLGGGWSLLDEPVAVWAGTMDRITWTEEVGEAGAAVRSVRLDCESYFSGRRRPKFAMLTHADQQLRSPGDLGLRFISTIANKDVQWPSF